MSHSAALPIGTQLDDRFILREVLGQGGFGIAYLADDRRVGDQVVLKELFPSGSHREASGNVLFADPAAASRLRQAFLAEVRTLARLKVAGVVTPRSMFLDRGTAYFASQLVPHALTAQAILDNEGPINPDRVSRWLHFLAQTLAEVHARGVLHRDLKPSNILIDAQDRPILIDFGSAREWHADQSQTQTILFTPGYAAPEQLAERSIRGPATDVYGLCATAWHLLTGELPPSAVERASGAELPSLVRLCPEIGDDLRDVLLAGLHLRYEARPVSMGALLDQLDHDLPSAHALSLDELDQLLARALRFRPEPRGCPQCDDLLEEARPIRKGACPVCRSGKLVYRDLNPRRCPICRGGVLRTRSNSPRPEICPSCRKDLVRKEPGVPWGPKRYRCACGATFVEANPEAVTLDGVTKSWEEWREISGRARTVERCEDCAAILDVWPDATWQHGNRRLLPEEWARVALGLDPGAGNAACSSCQAEFHLEPDAMTMLSAHLDPFGTFDRFGGRHLRMDQVPWVAVGKTSGQPGPLCPTCRLELDTVGDGYRLISATTPSLVEAIGEVRSLADWQRLGAGLPDAAELPALREQLVEFAAAQFVMGELAFDRQGSQWSGHAVHPGRGKGTLEVTPDLLAFRTLFKRETWPITTLLDAWGEDDELGLVFDDGNLVLKVEPVVLRLELQSGRLDLPLDASRLAARLRTAMGARAQ